MMRNNAAQEPDESQEQEENAVHSLEEEADTVFAEAIGEAPTEQESAPPADDTQQGTPDEEGKEEEGTGEEGAGSDDEAAAESAEDIEKRLRDTQSWAHAQAEENARLRAQLDEFRAKQKEAQAPAEDEIPEELQEFYEDYPEFQKAARLEAERLLRQQFGSANPADVIAKAEDASRRVAQLQFEQQVTAGYFDPVAGYIEGHPDAHKVVRSAEFREWSKSQAPEQMNTSDPGEAIRIIGRFKESQLQLAAAKRDAEAKVKADQAKSYYGGVPSGTSQGRPKKQAPSDDPEKIFAEAIKD